MVQSVQSPFFLDKSTTSHGAAQHFGCFSRSSKETNKVITVRRVRLSELQRWDPCAEIGALERYGDVMGISMKYGLFPHV